MSEQVKTGEAPVYEARPPCQMGIPSLAKITGIQVFIHEE